MKSTGNPMTKAQIDTDIKINAEFPHTSCAHEDVESEDLQNLIIWGFLYGDQCGIFINYPEDELDNQIKLNIKQMSNQKRYAVTVDLYFWSDNNDEAIKQAEDFADELRKDSDNQCKVVSVHDASTHKPVRIK